MAVWEFAISGSIGTPQLWPIIAGTLDGAIDAIVTTDNQRYQLTALILLCAFLGMIAISGIAVYWFDFQTTYAAVVPKGQEATTIEWFKIFAYCTFPEILVIGGGIFGLTAGIGSIQWHQIQQGVKNSGAPRLM